MRHLFHRAEPFHLRKPKGTNGKRKQKEIYAQTETESSEDRAGLQKTRSEQQRSQTPRLGHGQQVGQRRSQKRRRRPRQEAQQKLSSQGCTQSGPYSKDQGRDLSSTGRFACTLES